MHSLSSMLPNSKSSDVIIHPEETSGSMEVMDGMQERLGVLE